MITLWLDMCVCLADANTAIDIIANYCERERRKKKRGGGGGGGKVWCVLHG